MAGTNTPYMREYQRKKYARLRAEAVEILGGKCSICGSTDSLEIDHKEPKEKRFKLNQLVFRSREVFLAEIKKCQLLCYEHHRKKSGTETGSRISSPVNILCACGNTFKSLAAYMGHRRWRTC